MLLQLLKVYLRLNSKYNICSFNNYNFEFCYIVFCELNVKISV